MIRDLPRAERPRERLMNCGPGSLSNTELLAIILRTGRRGESVLKQAERVLAHFDGLRGLAGVDLAELASLPGVGKAKAATVLAALELGRRLSVTEVEEAKAIRSPRDVAELLMGRLRFLDREHFFAVLLNARNQPLAVERISIGHLTASLVHPRELFKAAIQKSAAAMILAHNHPSGDPAPSQEDVLLTRRLREGGELLGIEILDHVVFGDNRYVSLKERGLF
ncbi:MAG: DNA repair protein RadC [Firmicutes bacterium]|nr:DNA repair protein RadC [Bacillota bacterium]